MKKLTGKEKWTKEVKKIMESNNDLRHKEIDIVFLIHKLLCEQEKDK